MSEEVGTSLRLWDALWAGPLGVYLGKAAYDTIRARRNGNVGRMDERVKTLEREMAEMKGRTHAQANASGMQERRIAVTEVKVESIERTIARIESGVDRLHEKFDRFLEGR